MDSVAAQFYARRLQAVLRYLAEHLDGGSEEELSIERLSEVAGCSRFHFQRQFRSYVGVAPGELIGLLRLKRASLQLALDSSLRVIDVALDAGFASPEAFARAFRRAQGQSPSEFRKGPDWERWSETFRRSGTPLPRGDEMDVEIVSFPQTRVAVLEHEGPPGTLMASVSRFIEWRKSCEVSPERSSQTYGVPYSDPDQTAPEEFRFDICGTTTVSVPENAYGVIQKELPAGRCAVVTHRGSTDRISETVYRLYGEWLPQSGEQLRDFPCFFHYRIRMPRVSELEQETDVYLPLR